MGDITDVGVEQKWFVNISSQIPPLITISATRRSRVQLAQNPTGWLLPQIPRWQAPRPSARLTNLHPTIHPHLQMDREQSTKGLRAELVRTVHLLRRGFYSPGSRRARGSFERPS
jgi:hypothetical protein